MNLQGLFWEVEPPKSNEKKIPPAPVWLAPDYLPGLEEALRFDVPIMSEAEIKAAHLAQVPLICDVEIYPNYFLAAFMSTMTGKVFYFESEPCEAWGESPFESSKLRWVLGNFPIVTFNGIKFDSVILAMAIAGKSIQEMKAACDMMILNQIFPRQVLKNFQVEALEMNHIDLIEVCPLSASLKIYGGRLHCPRMQDLPFPPACELSPEQIAIVRHYCINDLTTTAFLYWNLQDQLAIRREMSGRYGLDLRSKSDAQIAEAVINSELQRMSGLEAKAPEILPGTCYHYHPPEFLTFKTPAMIQAFEGIKRARFLVAESGAIETPPELKDLTVKIGAGVYRLGIGGLHSSETSVSFKASPEFALVDKDVASYYPAIILNQRLCPNHLGADFITIYRALVEQRLAAKRRVKEIKKELEDLEKALRELPE